METWAWLVELKALFVGFLPVGLPGAQEFKGVCGNVTGDI